ncbi:MAG TPA: FAD-dependent oxidoreductase [Flavobacterium sp.]|nr:FAD-dependent oxidoreductase [Flavobacterium sp.]HPJ10807.1 FAD-dependent oxidoreductase [Flavobacterium sp.]
METRQIIIIGGGLAGLTSAIHLSKIGLQVTVIEKNEFLKHKVCGEYVSNEVLPYLQWLGVDVSELKPTQISKIIFSTTSGKIVRCKLPLGGFGVSRYALDEFLHQKALANGCMFLHESAENVDFTNDVFTVTTTGNQTLTADFVIGAYGKRSNLDQKLHRDFISRQSPWLAVKAHYCGDFPNDTVGLHNFKGGYCGVSKVENDKVNVCYLADYKTFKNYKNIEDYQRAVVSKNPNLRPIFENMKPLFEKPLTISQISFEKKQAVEKHVLMVGDSVGMIHPLCGNGMAMAIHSAKLLSELLGDFFAGKIESRAALEKKYSETWNSNFSNRLNLGRFLAKILGKSRLSENLMRLLAVFPSLLPKIINKTHGKALVLNT